MSYIVIVSLWVWLMGTPTTGNPTGATQCLLQEGAAFQQIGNDKYRITASPTGEGNVCPMDKDFLMGADDLAQALAAHDIKLAN